MVNNKNNSNAALGTLAEIMKQGESFVKMVRTGDGLGLNAEQKTEFLKQMKEQKADKQVDEMLEQFDALKTVFGKNAAAAKAGSKV